MVFLVHIMLIDAMFPLVIKRFWDKIESLLSSFNHWYYPANVILLGEVRKDISISLSVYSVSSDKVVLKADSDAVVKFFLPIVLNAVADRNELDFLSASGDEITISLNDISGLSSVLQSIILEQLYVFDDGIDVQATFK